MGLLMAAGLVLAASQIVFAQEKKEPPRPAPPREMAPMPENAGGPPPVLFIESEQVRPGQEEEHTKVVKGTLHVYEREKWPLQAITMSGVTTLEGEVVFLVALDSFGAIDTLEEHIGKSPRAAIEEFTRLESQESTMHVWKRSMLAIYRPDLSYRPDVAAFAKATLIFSNQHLVRFGHTDEYEGDMHFLADTFSKANADLHWYTYQVVSGAPNGTFIRFEPLRSFADWDAYGQLLHTVMQGLDDAGKKRLGQLFKDSIEQASGNDATPLARLYAVRPDLSSVSDEFAAMNPAFWRPKPPPAPASKPASKPAAKRKQQ
jgi:hypothetical protein